MRSRTVLLVAVLVLGTVCGPAASLAGAQQDRVTMTVLVKTAAGGTVSGADVRVSWDGGSAPVETTKSNGEALVDVPRGANVTIEIDHQLYVRNTPYTATDASERTVEVTVWRKASATVTVNDADGPVENARVVFRKQGDIVGIHSTNDGGEVESGIIESGEYTLSLFKPGYLRKAVTLSITEEGVETDVQMEQASATVAFQVFDDHFDPPQPISGVTIRGSDFSTTTQADGRAGAVVPVNTEITVTAEKDGYQTLTRTLVVREQDIRVNLTTSRTEAVQVALSNERIVVGETLGITVTDEYGDPLADATVYVDGTAVGQPNDQGVLRVPIETAGEHTVFAELDQVSSERLTVTGVESGQATDDGEPAVTVTVESTPIEPAGFLSLPGLGLIHLRSIAIGAAVGLLLAAGLFLYVRVG